MMLPKKPKPVKLLMTDTEKREWRNFRALVSETGASAGHIPDLVLLELDRLARKGNPQAMFLKNRIAIMNKRSDRENLNKPVNISPLSRTGSVLLGNKSLKTE